MVPYLRAANVTWQGISLHDVKEMDFSPAEQKVYGLRAGDVLLSEASGSPSEVGKPAVYRGELGLCCFQNTLIRVRTAVPGMSRFLHAHFVKDATLGLFGRASRGVGIHHLGAEATQDWKIALPPLQEQERLCDAIDTYLSSLDDAQANLERAQARLKAYRASVLKAAIEARLVPTEAELARAEGRAYEPASVLLTRIRAERRQCWEKAELARLTAAGKAPRDDKWKSKYQEPAEPDTSALPDLPDGWCWTAVDALVVSGPQNGLYMPHGKYGSGQPILRIDDYQADASRTSRELQRVQVSQADFERYGLHEGDMVVNRVNSPSHLGKTLAVEARHLPAMFESNMMRFEVATGVMPRFLQAYFSSVSGKAKLIANAKWAVNQASINQKDVERTVVPLPPQPEQERIVGEIDRLLSAAATVATNVSADKARIARLRQSILKWAFEGKLVDQDPNDEPAEQLLARIRSRGDAKRAERAVRESAHRDAPRAESNDTIRRTKRRTSASAKRG